MAEEERSACRYPQVQSAGPQIPLVSVSVVTHGHASFIRECLDSILSQEADFPYEVLIGEDGSTDETREICVEYARRFPEMIRLFLHNRSDVIYINGRPTGRYSLLYNIREARGKYIALCEGDDYWTDPNKLMKQVRFLESSATHVACFHDVDVLKMDGSLERNGSKANQFHRSDFSFRDLARIWCINTCSLVFRKAVLDLPDWYSGDPAGDRCLVLLLARFGRVRFLRDTMAVYRRHIGGMSSSWWDPMDGYVGLLERRWRALDGLTDFRYHDLMMMNVRQVRLRLAISREESRLRRLALLVPLLLDTPDIAPNGVPRVLPLLGLCRRVWRGNRLI